MLDANQFLVEAVTGERRHHGITQYRTKWVGFEEPTWEPEESFQYVNADDALVTNEEWTKWKNVRVQMVSIADDTLPNNYQEALAHPSGREFVEAMNTERQMLANTETIEEIVGEPPSDGVQMGSRWVYTMRDTISTTMKGTQAKARLVAQDIKTNAANIWGRGNTVKTFAPVVSMMMIRIALLFVWLVGFTMQSIDVRGAFLNASRDGARVVYISGPKGDPFMQDKWYRVRKALYGIRDSPARWFAHVKTFMLEHGLQPISADTCIFVKRVSGAIVLLILVYVDDMCVCGHNDEVAAISKLIRQRFEIHESSTVDKFVGVGIKVKHDTFEMEVRDKVEEVIREYETNEETTVKPSKVPIDVSWEKDPLKPATDRTKDEVTNWHKLVGSLLWITRVFRPDLGIITRVLAQFADAPVENMSRLALNVIGYLKFTRTMVMIWWRPVIIDWNVKVWVDASTPKALSRAKSSIGYIITVMNCAVEWKATTARSLKTLDSATSSKESECFALVRAVKRGLVVGQMVRELTGGGNSKIQVACDNLDLVRTVNGESGVEEMLYMVDKLNFVKDAVDKNYIEVRFVEGRRNPADPLTKVMHASKLEEFRKQLGIGVPGLCRELPWPVVKSHMRTR